MARCVMGDEIHAGQRSGRVRSTVDGIHALARPQRHEAVAAACRWPSAVIIADAGALPRRGDRGVARCRRHGLPGNAACHPAAGGSWLNSSIGSPMHSRSTHQASMPSTSRAARFDRGAVAGGDARLIHQRAAHADERGAGRQVGGDVARLDAAGRAERDVREHAAQRPDMRRAAGGGGREDLHHIGAGGQGGAHFGGRQRAQHQRGAGGPAAARPARHRSRARR